MVEQLEPRRLLSGGAILLGAEQQVNTFTQGDQSNAAIATDSSGNYVAVWNSVGQDGDARGIYGQRFNASGNPIGGEFRVNTTTTNDQIAPRIAMDAAGDFVVVWDSFRQDGDLWGIYAQRYNAAGVAQGGEFLVNNTYTTGTQLIPDVAMDASGDFVVVWYGEGPIQDHDGQTGGIYAQRYNASGVAQGGEFKVSGTTGSTDSIGSASKVAMDAAGDFVVTWVSSTTGTVAQRFDSSGNAVGSRIQVNSGGDFPSIAMDSAGNFAISASLNSFTQGSNQQSGVVVQQYHADGTANGQTLSPQPLKSAPGMFSDVGLNSNGLIVTWSDQNNIFLKRYDSEGVPQGDVVTVNTNSTAAKDLPALATVSNGVDVVWQSNGQDGSGEGIYAQRLSTDLISVHGLSQTTTYIQHSAAVSIAPNFVVDEPSGSQPVSATVVFANWQAEDRLDFYNTAALQHTFTQDLNAHTATLTLTGVASVQAYQTVLRSVTYQDVAGNPITTARTATLTVNDASQSASGTQTIAVVKNMDGVAASQTFVQGSPPLSVAPAIALALPPGTNVLSATISFTGWQGEDRLAFYNSAALQHSFVQNLSAHTAVLTITGTTSAATYQTLLRSVTYQDVAGNPVTAISRTATIAIDVGTRYTPSAVQTIGVANALAPVTSTQTYAKGTPPLAINPNLVVTVPADLMISGATVTFANWQGEDRLAFSNTAAFQHTFTQDLVNHTATLTLTGTASATVYQTVLRSVTYQDVAGNPLTSIKRLATFAITFGSRNASAATTISVAS